MELFRVSLAIRIRESLYSCCFLFSILMLCQVPHLEAYEEGDTCMIKQSLPGVCRSSSKCEPIINKYIQTGRLTIRDVPSCGLGPREEIVCCPVAECCDNDKGPSQVQRTTTRTTLQTTTTTEATRISSSMESGKGAANSNLDVESPYFDFQQLLNNKKKPQSQQLKPQPELKPDVPLVTHAASRKLPRSWPEDAQLPAQQGGMEKFQSVGPWGQASAPNQRTPKIINRPQTLMQPRPAFERRPTTVITTRRPQQQQPMDLIQLVNDQLREQGMQIVPAQQVKEIALTSERPIATTTTSTIASIDLDPWAPFRFRGNTNDDIVTNELGNGDVAAFGPETTTVRTFQPTPTTRVDVPTQERPAVRACRFIENRKKEEHLTIHILDGIPVEPGYYPHMAAIAFSNFGNFDYRCGGSLISSRHVLTAAHCFISDMPVHVRLGSVNIAEPTHHQDIAVSQNVMIHPDYVRSSKYNDVAILELVKEAELNFWVYPACLSLDLLDPPLNAQLFVAGWGTMNQTTRRTSKILLRAPLTVVPLPQCNELYAEQPMSVRNLKDGVIDSLMCAADTKESKKDACGGDSGGPLILETDIVNSKYTIMGIINSGFGCATKTPGLYTRVASFLDWIEKIVWPDNVV